MQQGLGRTGYLLLAFTFLAVGVLGIAMTVLAFTGGVPLFGWMGVGLAGTGMLGLFLFATIAPLMGDNRPAKAAPKAEPAREPEPEPTAVAAPRKEVDFEFQDPEPAPRAAPEELVVPQAFRETRPPTPGRDAAAWPGERGKSTWTRKVEHEAKVKQQVEDSPVRREMADRYTQTTPTVRAILTGAQEGQAPTQIAERAPEGIGPGFAAPGMSVGSCGRCSTVLMAPPQRPVRLKCPECAKITLLE